MLTDAARATLIDRLTPLIEPICTSLGLELVAVQFRREQHGQVLRIVIHHPDGIGIDQCAAVSRETSYVLDVEDFINQAYTLEVTSPGLDWPLKTEADFSRYIGKKADVAFRVDDTTIEKIQGVIVGVDESGVEVEDADSSRHRIALERVTKARLVIEF